MREILFKGKSKDSGEWVEGYYCKVGIGNDTKPSDVIFVPWKLNRLDKWGWIKIIPETLCQYTGMKDKGGNMIWENDIFQFDDEVWESSYTSCGTEWDSYEVTNYGVVGYCEYSARFDFIKYKYNQNAIEADLHENNDLDFGEFVSGLKVCGNYIDNTELLERR